MTATCLILLRHAEVEDKYHRIFGGRIDMNLSPRGHEQAAALAKHLRRTRFDAVYASPMRRVQQTLAPLLANGTPPPKILEGLREIDFGDWTGRSWEEVCQRHQVAAIQWLELLERGDVPNAETGAAFRARVEPCLRQIVETHPGETVAVACHGGVVRALLAIALDLPLPQMAAFEVDYASVTLLEMRERRGVLESLNFVPWRNGA